MIISFFLYITWNWTFIKFNYTKKEKEEKKKTLATLYPLVSIISNQNDLQ